MEQFDRLPHNEKLGNPDGGHGSFSLKGMSSHDRLQYAIPSSHGIQHEYTLDRSPAHHRTHTQTLGSVGLCMCVRVSVQTTASTYFSSHSITFSSYISERFYFI